MKPRTILQHEVIDKSEKLPFINKQMKQFAIDKCLMHVGYMTKSRVLCMDCGESFSPDLVHRKRAVCPHCNTKLRIEESRKRTLKQITFVAIADIMDDFQIIRNYVIRSLHKAGQKAQYDCMEILQHWVRDDGKREVVARRRSVNWYVDSWSGDMEIRNKDSKYHYSVSRIYDITPDKYHPRSRFKKEYKLYGIDGRYMPISFLDAIELLPNEPRLETLLKARQHSILSHVVRVRRHLITQHWKSIKIALRNKYRVKDAGMWEDYLQLLLFFDKDLRNAHYVCPKNLKKEHDRYVKRHRRFIEKEAEEARRKKAIEDEAYYREFIKKFEDVFIKSGDLTIEPIKTVADFIKEGDELNHCVFSNEYYKRRSSLIMSARVNGKRTETVEFSLDKAQVVQSRGLQNSNTDYHDKIVNLVNRNSAMIVAKVGG